MIDLKQIIEQHPDSEVNTQKLKGILLDLCPNETASIAILTAILKQGMAEEIKRNGLDQIRLDSYVNRLESELGYSPKLSQQCLELWAAVYSETPFKQTCSQTTYTPLETSPCSAVNQSTVDPVDNGIEKQKTRLFFPLVVIVAVIAVVAVALVSIRKLENDGFHLLNATDSIESTTILMKPKFTVAPIQTPKTTAMLSPKPTVTPTPLSTVVLTLKPTATVTPTETIAVTHTATSVVMPTATPTTEVIYQNVKVGDCITFGLYEQDNISSNGKEDIEWLVLSKEKNKALIISKYAIDRQPYSMYSGPVTWENSFIRVWLNETFVSSAFSTYEQSKILTTLVTADDNQYYGTNAGNNTYDKVFLLSIAEVEKYFGSERDRECMATKYADCVYLDPGSNGLCHWWLRSPGATGNLAAFIYYDGCVHGYSQEFTGNYVDERYSATRPAMWIDLEK